MNALDALVKYMGNGLIVLLYLAATLYLFLTEKRKNYRLLFIYCPVILLLIFLNPFCIRFFYRFMEGEIYYRILWLLPMSTVLCFTAVTIAASLQGRKKKLFVAAAILTFTLGGSCIYNNPFYSKAENVYHVPQSVVDICDTLRVEGREIMVAMPMELVNFVRQYDATICLPYGRTADIYYDELGYMLEQQEMDAELLAEKSRERYCHYLVFDQKKTIHGQLEDYGFELYTVMDGYMIYKDTTQYFGL